VSLVRIVGFGPGDPDLVTIGALEALRAAPRTIVALAPPDLVLFLRSESIAFEPSPAGDAALLVRGSQSAVDAFVASLAAGDIALGVPGDPRVDLPALPMLARALELAGHELELVPGMPRATLADSRQVPLVPLPPGSTRHGWHELVGVMARLRRGCPWDREQTHASLVPYLIEEAYETVEAIEAGEEGELCEELGDVLLQVLFHAELAAERGAFTIADVVDGLANKMIRRHPHVFGESAVSGMAELWQNWERVKALEPTGRKRESRLDGIPRALGALQRGQKMQEKAARVGFDWPDRSGIRAKLAEELAELEEALRDGDPAAIRDEAGDLVFTVANLVRSLGIDAEGAMRGASDKFERRFRAMERRARAEGRTLDELGPDDLEALWRLAKADAA